jgi:hypothetical protein
MTDAVGEGRDRIAVLVGEIAGTGRGITDDELELVREQVARAGYDPNATTKAGMLLDGLVWEGRRIASSDRLDNALAHYLRHAIVQREWPPGTTFGDYVESLRRSILDPSGGLYLDRYFGVWEFSFVAASGPRRGPGGADWILVGYQVEYGFWVTGFQPQAGLGYLARTSKRTDGRWLRRPS